MGSQQVFPLEDKQVAKQFRDTLQNVCSTIYTEIYGKPCMCNFDKVNSINLECNAETVWAKFVGFREDSYQLINRDRIVSFKFTIQNAPFVVSTLANGVLVSYINKGVFESRVFASGEIHKKVCQFGEYANKLFNGFRLFESSIHGFCIEIYYCNASGGYSRNFSCHV